MRAIALAIILLGIGLRSVIEKKPKTDAEELAVVVGFVIAFLIYLVFGW